MGLPEQIGTFEVVRLLGAGGMGEVFLARDPDLDRMVAIKRLLRSRTTASKHLERFRREAKIAARLDHPAIVRIYGMIEDDDQQCIVMEYVAGQNLRELMSEHPLSVDQVIVLARPIAEALAVAHDHQIVHRDLKSENVLITGDGQVKITDFGIAKMLGEESLTADGALVGTVRAMSPEQVLDKPVDRRSDMFSFGILLYEMLSGKSPFRAENSFITLQRILHARHRPITELVPDLPEALSDLIDQLLAKAPLHRPRDFHEIRDALEQLGDGISDSRHPGIVLGGQRPSPTLEDTAVGDGHGDSVEPDAPDLATPDPGWSRAGPGVTDTPAQATVDLGPRTDRNAVTPPPRAAADADPPDADQPVPLPRASSRRLRTAAVALALAGAAALGGYTLWPAKHSPTSAQVIVLAPTVQSPTLRHRQLLRELTRDELARAASVVRGVAIVPHHRVEQVSDQLRGQRDGEPSPTDILQALAADELLSARLSCQSDSECAIEVDLVRAGQGVTATANGQIALDDNLDAVRIDIAAAVHQTLYSHRTRDDQLEPWLVAPDARLELARLQRDFWDVRRPREFDATRAAVRDLRARQPGLLALYGFELSVLHQQFLELGDKAYLDHAASLLAAAPAYLQDAPYLRDRQLVLAFAADDRAVASASVLAQARPIKDQLERDYPRSRWTSVALGHWHLENNDPVAARRHYSDAFARQPAASILIQITSADIRLGEWAAARAHLDDLLVMAPDHFRVRYLQVILTRHDGDIACAEKRLRAMTRHRRSFDSCYEHGLLRQLLGGYLEAAEQYGCASAYRDGASVDIEFNIAETYSAFGQRDTARRRFERLRDALDRMSDAERGRHTILRGMTAAHLAALGDAAERERAQATGARLERLAHDSEDLDTLYYAAVTRALLGDTERAIALVGQLLEREYTIEYFRFPWFKAARAHFQLDERLRARQADSACAAGPPPG